jgi:outer membrane protein assembly factor BamB
LRYGGLFSAAPRSERWGAIVLMIVSLFLASRLLHVSIATANMGIMLIIFSIPIMSLAFVIWAVATSRLSMKLRYISMVVTIICSAVHPLRVEDGLLYTQEQLGDDEAVTCYNLSNGKPVWIHRYKARFWDSHAGSGPRATPTISYGRLYTFGATVILNVYDSRSGAVKWSRNAATDTGAENSGWGFTGSPLVVDYLVIVAASGELVAYNIATGKPCWFGPDGSKGYSSPHLFTIDEVPQIVLLSDTGAVSVVPSNGKILWEYPWPQVLLHRIRNRGVIV